MNDPLVQQLLDAIVQVTALYNRLALVVGPLGAGKTVALRGFAEFRGTPVINVNLEMSRALLEVPRAQRSVTAPRVLKELVEATPGDTVVLDNIEILFAPDLKLDPLRALRQLSRDRTLVASWNGRVEGDRLLYAEPSHPEYRDYPAQGLTLVLAKSGPPGTTS